MNAHTQLKTAHILALVSGLLLALIAADAKAAPPVAVGPITIRDLRAHTGKTLYAFFVSGRPAEVGLRGTTIHSYALMRDPVTARISASGEARIEATQVPAIIRNVRPFNYMVLLVGPSDGRTLYLRNTVLDADSPTGFKYTYPYDARANEEQIARMPDSSFAHEIYGFVSRAKLEEMRASRAPLRHGIDF
jgi:hypothetical protein